MVTLSFMTSAQGLRSYVPLPPIGEYFEHMPFLGCFKRHQDKVCWASLLAQWLRTHLPVQETWVRSLSREDPCAMEQRGSITAAAVPQLLSLCPDPRSHGHRALSATTGACARLREKLLQIEVHVLGLERAQAAMKTQHTQINK